VSFVPSDTEGHIRHLSPEIQGAAWWMVYLVRSAGIPLKITSTLRSREEQEALVRSGASQTVRSKHLIGQAFDVDIQGWGRNEIPLWWWEELGWLGEYLGLRWGGRWTGFRDYGHFENPRSFV